MELGKDVIVGVSVNNTLGITGKGYSLSQLLTAARETSVHS